MTVPVWRWRSEQVHNGMGDTNFDIARRLASMDFVSAADIARDCLSILSREVVLHSGDTVPACATS